MSERKYDEYTTEAINPNSRDIDRVSTLEMVKIINAEDRTVADAVAREAENIAAAIDAIAPRLKNGGRLIYIGAGTSGRLGVLDASECPPTYGVSPELIQGVMAGGRDAMFRSSEGREDEGAAAVSDLKAVDLSKNDVCFAISASGSAEYVLSALRYAHSLGALTVSLSCQPDSLSSREADIAITPVTGPEVIAGSTRMKAGTAQKMVLNMISTGVMIRLGRVWHNMMVCMRPSNRKLAARAARIISSETGVSQEQAEEALTQAGGCITDAIELLKKGIK